MKTYFGTVSPTRADFLDTITDHEEKILGDHFNYLTELNERGVLSIAGPCLDGSMGILIIKAESLEAAKNYIKADPAVIAGVFSIEVKEVRISVGALT